MKERKRTTLNEILHVSSGICQGPMSINLIVEGISNGIEFIESSEFIKCINNNKLDSSCPTHSYTV